VAIIRRRCPTRFVGTIKMFSMCLAATKLPAAQVSSALHGSRAYSCPASKVSPVHFYDIAHGRCSHAARAALYRECGFERPRPLRKVETEAHGYRDQAAGKRVMALPSDPAPEMIVLIFVIEASARPP
jgi:hypothetical protein